MTAPSIPCRPLRRPTTRTGRLAFLAASVCALFGGCSHALSVRDADGAILDATTKASATSQDPAAPAPPLASSTAAAPETNPNLRDFDFVVEKLRINYAGWETKVTDATRPQLDALTAQLRAEAADATPERFTGILRDWLAFFGDRHVGAAPMSAAQPSPPDAAAAAARTPRRDWTEASVRDRLAQLGDRRDPLEGIWNIDDRYRVAVLRAPDKEGAFAGVVLTTASEAWRPGQVKAEFTRLLDGTIEMLFRAGDHSEHRQPATLLADGCLLRSDRWGTWLRELPALPGSVTADLRDRVAPGEELFLRPLSDRTLWLRLPDFDNSRAQPLADLLASAAERLATCPNLLIDLRDNGGGSDFVYGPLMPWLYTRPVYGVGVELRASADNLALRRRLADELRAQQPDIAQKLDDQNARMQRSLGGYILNGEKPFTIARMDEVRPFPKRVAILIDGAGSSGEQFLLAARQSRKVTLFGQRNSAGVLDFANVVAMDTPSGRHRVFWATSRSLRLPEDPVDPDGIAPDVRIPPDVFDPVGHALAWLERQVD